MSIIPDMIEEQNQLENWKIELILNNLRYLPFSSEEKLNIEAELFNQYLTNDKLQELFEMIIRNIPEPIESGLNYNMGDIHRKLDKINKDERK